MLFIRKNSFWDRKSRFNLLHCNRHSIFASAYVYFHCIRATWQIQKYKIDLDYHQLYHHYWWNALHNWFVILFSYHWIFFIRLLTFSSYNSNWGNKPVIYTNKYHLQSSCITVWIFLRCSTSCNCSIRYERYPV